MPGLSEVLQPLKNTSIEELQEQADEIDFLTPREFAKLMGVKPQQVYQWIRKDVLVAERCKCGRTVVCVSKAKATLEARKISRGEVVDNRADQPGDEGFGSAVLVDDVPELSQEDSIQET